MMANLCICDGIKYLSLKKVVLGWPVWKFEKDPLLFNGRIVEAAEYETL